MRKVAGECPQVCSLPKIDKEQTRIHKAQCGDLHGIETSLNPIALLASALLEPFNNAQYLHGTCFDQDRSGICDAVHVAGLPLQYAHWLGKKHHYLAAHLPWPVTCIHLQERLLENILYIPSRLKVTKEGSQ